MTTTEKLDTVGGFARNIIMTQPKLTNQQILDLVKAKFPQNRTGLASIAWYKADIKKRKLTAAPLTEAARTVDTVRAELAAAQVRCTELETELGGLEIASKRDKVVAMVELLVDQGIPISEEVAQLAKAFNVPLPGEETESEGEGEETEKETDETKEEEQRTE